MDAEKEIKELQEELNRRNKGKTELLTKVIIGSYLPELKLLCDAVMPYAVVIGSQGSSALARTIFGSNAIQTMVRLSWPVIAVPAQMKYRAIKKIALACDLNHAAELVPVNYLKSMVTDFNCQLDVINIGSDNYFSPGDVFESGLLRKKLQPLNPRYHFITAKDVNEAILDFIEMNEVDLLMVLPRIHGLLDRLFYRSHTKHLVLHSHVPVMAIHSTGLKTP
jgi:nucleotide-binding universal stress UspA family protein